MTTLQDGPFTVHRFPNLSKLELVGTHSFADKYIYPNPDASSDGFITKAILAHQRVYGSVYYAVEWEGYSVDEATWEPEENLKGAELLLQDYWTWVDVENLKENREKLRRTVMNHQYQRSQVEYHSTSDKNNRRHDKFRRSLAYGVRGLRKDGRSRFN